MAENSAAEHARWVLCLATGGKIPDGASPTWDAVLRVAVAERCAPLCWLRSGAVIRAGAPAAVVGQWRSVAVEADARGRRQLEALLSGLRALERDGVEAVVLKGAPLAARLYGNAHVRATADIDLWVPLALRPAARSALERAGWTHQDGESPWEESMARPDGDRPMYLDVHSSLLDHTLAHLPEHPPASETMALEGQSIRVHAGALVPAFLAAHLAKHRLAPLLWLLDLRTLWGTMSESARRDAVREAEGAGLARYLSWGVRRTLLLAPAAEGDRGALRALGFGGGGRRETHPMYRDARLAPDVVSAFRVLVAWAWPRPLRHDSRAFARRCAARIGAAFTRPSPGRQTYGHS